MANFLRAGPEFRDMFLVHKELGKGTFGKTYLVTMRSNGQQYVIKRMYILNSDDLLTFRHEVQVQIKMAEDGISPMVHAHWIHNTPQFASNGKVRRARKNEVIGIGMILMDRMEGTLFDLLQNMMQREHDTQKVAAVISAHMKEVGALIQRVNKDHYVTHGDCTAANVMFITLPGGALRFFLIDWGYSQAFFPGGVSKTKDVPVMRWHRRQVEHYDAGLLEWDVTYLMDYYNIPRRISLLPRSALSSLLQRYAYKTKRGVDGDAWQNFAEDHPLARSLTLTPPGGATDRVLKRHDFLGSEGAPKPKKMRSMVIFE